jgi:hypothetical protein
MDLFPALVLAAAALLLMACTGPGAAPRSYAERTMLADEMVGTDPMTTGEIPSAPEAALP